MNKQQLAAQIWNVANDLRGKVSASNYKDYMLGLIFYKYISYHEEIYLRTNLFTEPDSSLNEEKEDLVKNCKDNIGYFIAYDNLFSKWIKDKDFQIKNVRTALSAFSRNIGKNYQKVYNGIFNTLEKGLDSLGSTDPDRTKELKKLLKLIDRIPVDNSQDYDVLGFVYEYLLKNFAANAGKAGEFYTPHEASVVMSEIIANHLKDRDEISIYDSTSGSGSLLLNIGKSISKYTNNPDSVKYYAQELIENTYNLTRMNLLMRDIIPDNIIIRNGDTLKDDWPFFDENDKEKTYNPVFVDSCCSNPPYSQKWDITDADSDKRFKDYGVAPKGKADYAFLLHNLYHLKPDGIMTIVLPHGVLFRGGEEEVIRKKLVESDKIDTIIGLPANMFFGTGIPTIIMVLKKQRNTNDILFIDASKGFTKDGNKNKLKSKDVRKIVDTVIERKTIPNYSRVVSKEEISGSKNNYNLNISRYIDASEEHDVYDLYATMFGGIPNHEIDELKMYWTAFPTLRNQIFHSTDIPYSVIEHHDIKSIIMENQDVKTFIKEFDSSFKDFPAFLRNELIENFELLEISKEDTIISSMLKKKLKNLNLIDYYDAYQIFSDNWSSVSIDLEIMQNEDGLNTAKVVDENIVQKTNSKTKEIVEVQEGYVGKIIPFELIYSTLLKDKSAELHKFNLKLHEAESDLETLIDSLSDEEKDNILNDDNSAFDVKKVANECKIAISNISTPEIEMLKKYLTLTKKEKFEFVKTDNIVDWSVLSPSKDGTYKTNDIKKRIKDLADSYSFEEGTFDYTLVKANELINTQKEIKKIIKNTENELQIEAKEMIESLSNEQIKELLYIKWIETMMNELYKLPHIVLDDLVKKVTKLQLKYKSTFLDIEAEIKDTEFYLSSLIDNLKGNEFDMKGLSEFKSLLGANYE